MHLNTKLVTSSTLINQIPNTTDTGRKVLFGLVSILMVILPGAVFAHGVDEGTQQFLANNEGVAILPFLYIGAKHMITGYDHLLFLVGVIFFLYRPKDVLVYVSFFTLGLSDRCHHRIVHCL